jgi:hypothetical protein
MSTCPTVDKWIFANQPLSDKQREEVIAWLGRPPEPMTEPAETMTQERIEDGDRG